MKTTLIDDAAKQETASETIPPIAGRILAAFKDNEYLNVADFRLLAEGKGDQAVTAAVDYLTTNNYIVELNIYDDDLDGIETGNAETIYTAVKPIGEHGKE